MHKMLKVHLVFQNIPSAPTISYSVKGVKGLNLSRKGQTTSR